MSSYGYTNPFSVCFTSMKIRYNEYDHSIDSMNFVKQDDKINVFINLESVLNNLSMIKDVDNKLLLERAFPTIIESEAINLCAHYKRFFKSNGLSTKVYLCYTDLSSESFHNYKWNDEYRSYYINKYTNNPRFQLLGNKLIERIIPRIQKIMEFIPDVYMLSGNGIDGSLIPYIISKENPDHKNFIISTDKYDTQYQLMKDKFCVHYIRKSPMGASIIPNFNKYLSDLLKEHALNENDLRLFDNPSFNSMLISTLGDKMRSIDPLKGMGAKTLVKYLNNGISGGIISQDTNSIEMIKKAFPYDLDEFITNNFNCINIERQYNDLSQQEVFSITNQIVDRFDYNSLIQLNKTIYKDYPLMLPELTC